MPRLCPRVLANGHNVTVAQIVKPKLNKLEQQSANEGACFYDLNCMYYSSVSSVYIIIVIQCTIYIILLYIKL